MNGTHELKAQLDRLRPRDLDVVRGLVEHVALGEKGVAEKIGMSVSTLKTRLRHAYVVLGVSSRVELYARYHVLLLSCACQSLSLDESDRLSAIDQIGSDPSKD